MTDDHADNPTSAAPFDEPTAARLLGEYVQHRGWRQPEVSVVYNDSDIPEPVLTRKQLDTARRAA